VAFDPLSINVGVNSMTKGVYVGLGFKTKWNFFHSYADSGSSLASFSYWVSSGLVIST
jgi:hypothetical protein